MLFNGENISFDASLFIYGVIQNDGLNFVILYFKIRTSDKCDMA